MLLQEDGFALLQEDGFALLTEDDDVAANIIQFDRTKLPIAEAVAALTVIRDGRERLKRARDAMTQFRDGADNPADPANYALLTTTDVFAAGGYATANHAARAAYMEIDSVLAKLLTDASVVNVLTAVDQACAKLGV
jgi:hypothetical protein